MNNFSLSWSKPPFAEVRILCVGSPFAGDSIGMRLGERLLQRQQHAQLPSWIQVVCADRPGMSMLWEFEQAECVVIVDALRSEMPAGSVVQLPVQDLFLHDMQVSSHEIGVAQVLAMASMLGSLPKSLFVFGVSVGETLNWLPGLEQLNQVADRVLEQIAACLANITDEYHSLEDSVLE